jgi:hypothetical protein
MTNAMSDIGKYGLKGNTGLCACGVYHVSAPYDSNGKVFVSIRHKQWGEIWRRVSADKANPARVIRCSMCDKPAVSLDHLWPYHSEMNRCAKHYGRTPCRT